MKLFSRWLLTVSTSLMLLALVTGQAMANQVTGSAERSTATILFMNDSSQTAIHVTKTTKMPEGATVASLVGQRIDVTYHQEGNRNIADSIMLAAK